MDEKASKPQLPQQNPMQDICSLPMVMIFLVVFLIMFNRELRVALGEGIGELLYPIIGFDYSYPIWTIFLAGIIMVTITTCIRHYFIDWVKVTRAQKLMSAFQKELREATLSRNAVKKKRLEELQPEIMQHQTTLMSSQFKPMAFTMIVAIPIFMSLYVFIGDLSYPRISLPWKDGWSLDDKFTFLPHWILLYSLLSIPFGQSVQKILKYFSFKKKLEN